MYTIASRTCVRIRACAYIIYTRACAHSDVISQKLPYIVVSFTAEKNIQKFIIFCIKTLYFSFYIKYY